MTYNNENRELLRKELQKNPKLTNAEFAKIVKSKQV